MKDLLSQIGINDLKIIIKKVKKRAITIIPNPNNVLIIKTPSPKNVYTHIKENIDWIKETFEKYNNHYFNVGKRLKEGFILFKGQYIPYFLEDSSINRAYVYNDKLIIKHNGIKLIKDIIKIFLKNYAKKEFFLIAKEYSEMLSISINSVRIKDTSSRWGSCSSKGNINLSFRLIMAPECVYRYVILHEIAHIKFPNHSKEFWSYLNNLYPNYKIAKIWLKENGIYLHTI